MEKKRIIGLSVAAVLLLGATTGIVLASQPRNVDFTEYVHVTVEGTSSKGKVTDFFIEDYFPDDLQVEAKINKIKNISNGDVLDVNVSYNKEAAKKYGLKVVNTHKNFKVERLFDPAKEEHNFIAEYDMSDVVAKVMLDSVLEEVNHLIGIINPHDEKITDACLFGVYVDKESGKNTSAVVKVSTTDNEEETKDYYCCFSVSELEQYIAPTSDDCGTIDVRNTFEYKTDHSRPEFNYCVSMEEVDEVMQDIAKETETEVEFINYKWQWNDALKKKYTE